MIKTQSKAPDFDGTQPCRAIKLDMFFPVEKIEEQKMKAIIKPICDSCGFQAACLEWALQNRELGIWAGTTDHDRKLILRRRRHK